MIRVIAAIVLSVLAVTVHAQTTLPNIFTRDRDIRATPLQADLNTLVGAINSLSGRVDSLTSTVSGLSGSVSGVSGRVAKLEGNITAADLVGIYRFDGFQTELGANHVSNYTYHGTATLTATSTIGGDLTLSSPEKGTQLNLVAPRATTLTVC